MKQEKSSFHHAQQDEKNLITLGVKFLHYKKVLFFTIPKIVMLITCISNLGMQYSYQNCSTNRVFYLGHYNFLVVLCKIYIFIFPKSSFNFFVLVVAFLPILFSLVLNLSFIGLISRVLLLPIYYVIFPSFSPPSCITKLYNYFDHYLIFLNTHSQHGKDSIPETAPFVLQKVRINKLQSKASTLDK